MGIRHGHASASSDTWGTQHADHIPQGRWCQGNQKVAQGTGPRKPKARLPGRCHGEQRPPRKGGQRCSEPRWVEGASEGQADLVLSPPPGSDCRRTFRNGQRSSLGPGAPRRAKGVGGDSRGGVPSPALTGLPEQRRVHSHPPVSSLGGRPDSRDPLDPPGTWPPGCSQGAGPPATEPDCEALKAVTPRWRETASVGTGPEHQTEKGLGDVQTPGEEQDKHQQRRQKHARSLQRQEPRP